MSKKKNKIITQNKILKQNQINNIKEVKVFEQFKRQQLFKNISFVFLALILGFGINNLIFSKDIGKNIQANILKSKTQNEEKADIYLQTKVGKENSILKLKSGTKMNNVVSLSFSLLYNQDVTAIEKTMINITDGTISTFQEEPGIITLIVTFSEKTDIKKGENILNISTSREEKLTQQMNIINANFTDNTDINYELTTSGVTF